MPEAHNAASPDRLLTAAEVAHILGISERGVWRNASAGRIPKPVRVGAGTSRWPLSRITAFLAELAPPEHPPRHGPRGGREAATKRHD